MARGRTQPIPHVHADGQVTIDRIRAFADAPDAEQLQALSMLRFRASNYLADTLALTSAAFAFLIGFVALIVAIVGGSYETWPASWGAVADVLDRVTWALIVLLVFAAPYWMMVTGRKRAWQAGRARVLLGAYEAELARRQQARGRAARVWQRQHPIRWGSPQNRG